MRYEVWKKYKLVPKKYILYFRTRIIYIYIYIRLRINISGDHYIIMHINKSVLLKLNIKI